MSDKYINDIKVWLYKQNHPIIHLDAKTYEKGSFFCVYEPSNKKTFKYPVMHIWRVQESYPDDQRAHKEEKKEIRKEG